jgi:hypothetical protein
MELFKRYRLKLLRRRAAGVDRAVRLCNPDDIQKVGILWNEEDQKTFSFLHEQFKSQRILVRNLCYSGNKHNSDSNTITPRDLNWLGFPKGGAVETFCKTDFDLLINISVVHNFALDVITAMSVATFKIGWDRESLGFFDLSVDVSTQPDSMYLAEQQIYYLKLLNKKNIL